MAVKRKDLESCASSAPRNNKKTKLRRASVDAPPGFGGITTAASPTSSSPRYWKHFLHYQRQFSKLSHSSSSSPGVNSKVSNQASCRLHSPAFDNKEHEESYLGLKSREMKLVYQNYADEYPQNTKLGHLVLKQRRFMIRWIVDVSWVRYETTFLAVSLLDRCLARGFFHCSRHLQLLGIACLMLASRLEENQRENEMMEQSKFHVEDNTYYLSEIIAMEWLVQNVLGFQCFVPTVYNFLGLYLKAVNTDAELEKAATKLALISLLDHGRLCYPPSTVAAASVILASLHSDQESFCQHMLTMTDDVQHCTESLGKWLEDYDHNQD